MAERCHARRSSRPSWRIGETTGNKLKYLEPAKELVKHVDQRFVQVKELTTIKIGTLTKITGQDPSSQPRAGTLHHPVPGLPDRSGGAAVAV